MGHWLTEPPRMRMRGVVWGLAIVGGLLVLWWVVS